MGPVISRGPAPRALIPPKRNPGCATVGLASGHWIELLQLFVKTKLRPEKLYLPVFFYDEWYKNIWWGYGTLGGALWCVKVFVYKLHAYSDFDVCLHPTNVGILCRLPKHECFMKQNIQGTCERQSVSKYYQLFLSRLLVRHDRPSRTKPSQHVSASFTEHQS